MTVTVRRAGPPSPGPARLATGHHSAQLDALGVRVRGQLGVVLRAELDGRDAQVGQHLLRRDPRSASATMYCSDVSVLVYCIL